MHKEDWYMMLGTTKYLVKSRVDNNIISFSINYKLLCFPFMIVFTIYRRSLMSLNNFQFTRTLPALLLCQNYFTVKDMDISQSRTF